MLVKNATLKKHNLNKEVINNKEDIHNKEAINHNKVDMLNKEFIHNKEDMDMINKDMDINNLLLNLFMNIL